MQIFKYSMNQIITNDQVKFRDELAVNNYKQPC